MPNIDDEPTHELAEDTDVLGPTGESKNNLNQDQRWALKRLRAKQWHDAFELGKTPVYDVLEENLLRAGSPLAEAVSARTKALLKRIAKKTTLARTGSDELAHALVPVLCDGLEHPSSVVRLLAASQFVSVSQANAFRKPPDHYPARIRDRFDGAAIERVWEALARRMNEDDDDSVAIEAGRQLWLMVRTHAKTNWTITPDQQRLDKLKAVARRVALTRSEPHPHVEFFAGCVKASLQNASVPRGSKRSFAPQWPTLVPPLPDISLTYRIYDYDHDSSSLACSFTPQKKSSSSKPKPSRNPCGVCSSRQCVVAYYEKGGHYGADIYDWEDRCETCGCFTQGWQFVRTD